MAVRMNLAAASAELWRYLSKPTKQAMGTDAISKPKKNNKKWLALIIMFMPKRVEIMSR